MDSTAVQITPTPGYVIKTRLLAGPSVGTKVFLNVCHAPQVPPPDSDFDPAVAFGLIVDNKWEIPIFVSPQKTVLDKKGTQSLCFDCCVNTRCFNWITINADLRSIVDEWSIEAVEFMYSMTLDRSYSVPKMLSKGELARPVVQAAELTQSALQKRFAEISNNEALALVDNMDDGSDTELSIFPKEVQKKPLIEEIERPATTKPRKKNSDKTREATRDVPYEVSISKVFSESAPHTLVVKFRCAIDANLLNVTCDTQNVQLNFRSKASMLGGHPTVSVPLPTHISTSHISAFYLTPESSLYIFV